MEKIIITVKNSGGLTSRSSAELVEEANHYRCHVTLKLETSEECDLKSIMNVFGLPPVPTNSNITILFEGDDEKEGIEKEMTNKTMTIGRIATMASLNLSNNSFFIVYT